MDDVVTAWMGTPWTVLDTETTDPDPDEARVVEICAGTVTPGVAPVLNTALINPGVEIPAGAIAVHHITNERVQAEGKPPPEVLDLYVGDLARSLRAGHPLVIMNASYDLTVLDRDCKRHGVPTLTERMSGHVAPVIDVMVIDKQILRYRKRVSDTQGARCLKTLAQVHGVGWDDEQAHGAQYDALQAARVLWRIGQRCFKPAAELVHLYGLRYATDTAVFRSLADMDLMRLHAVQADWYRQQQEGLDDYWTGLAHKAALVAEQATARFEASDDPAVREAADQERMAAEAEIADLKAKVASLSTHWPIRPTAQEATR